MASDNVQDWTIADVEVWLKKNGFAAYINLLCNTHKIDGKTLLLLTEADLRNEIEAIGDFKRMMICIKQLQKQNSKAYYELANHSILLSQDHPKNHMAISISDGPQVTFVDHVDMMDGLEYSRKAEESKATGMSHIVRSNRFSGEHWKILFSFLYVVFGLMLTSLTNVIVNNRVPDRTKYPPLPDIILDNIPHIPWAFGASENISLFLLSIWILILIFHKHRFILLRRMFAMFGTVYVLRCVTVLLTSLSIPGSDIKCTSHPVSGVKDVLYQTVQGWKNMGMSVDGVRFCGDYMYSGHTCVLTLFNFFIIEYSPRKMHYLHTIVWVLSLFGMFFILAAHEHYSIDVLIAFYIASRLFLYYHTLANNWSLMVRDRKRIRFWFPLFAYFEANCDRVVPNEYEWPFRWPQSPVLDRLIGRFT